MSSVMMSHCEGVFAGLGGCGCVGLGGCGCVGSDGCVCPGPGG